MTLDPLTEREAEILGLVAAGLSNAEVARREWVSEQTVKAHLTHIYRKLGVRNRTAAAMWLRDREQEAARGTTPVD